MKISMETREEQKRPMAWKPAPSGGVLGLENHPDWVFKWGNTSVQGDSQMADTIYVKNLQEGWFIVDPKDHKELSAPHLSHLIKDSRVVRKGQILLKMPRQLADSRRNYWMNEDRKKRSVNIADAAFANAPSEAVNMGDSIAAHRSTRQTLVGENARNA